MNFVVEQARIGAFLGRVTAAGLSWWVAEHPALAGTEAQSNAMNFLEHPLLPIGVTLGHRPLSNAVVSTIQS